MNHFESLIFLFKSFSLAEKKEFKTWLNTRSNHAAFTTLYRLIEKNIENTANIEAEFARSKPGSSFKMASSYLYDMVISFIISFDKKYEQQWKLQNKLREIAILFDRGIEKRAHLVLKKIKENEEYAYSNIDKYLLHSPLQNQWYNTGQPLNEKDIVKSNLFVRELLLNELNLLEHFELYQIIYNRFLIQGPVKDKKEIEKLNDLLFLELQLVSSKPVKTKEITRAHQLFQAVYFFMTGNPEAALDAFSELNELLKGEENQRINYYYFFIKSLLFTLKRFRLQTETTRIIEDISSGRLDSLLDHWQKTALLILFGSDVSDEEKNQKYQELTRKFPNIPENEKSNLALVVSLKYMESGNSKKAQHLLVPYLFLSKEISGLYIFRYLKLLHIFLLFSEQDFINLKYEVRNYKRQFNVSGEFELKSFVFFYQYGALNQKYNKTYLVNNFIELCIKCMGESFASHFLIWFDYEKWANRLK